MYFQAYSLKNHPEWACIQTKTPDSEARTPVHLCCVIDVSASMESDAKLDNVKKSLQFLIDFLGPSDKLSIITFSEAGKTFINQVNVLASEKENIRAQISLLRPEANTNLSSGIVTARSSLLTNTSEIKQGILLLTDGHANLGLTRPADIIELIQNTNIKFPGTSISSIGYGTDHNIELLQTISTESGGSYYVVNNLEDVAVVFGDILGGLVSCVAQQVRVTLPSGTEIKSRYATNIVNGRMDVIIGDMPAGSEGVFLAKISTSAPIELKGYNLQTHSEFQFNSVVKSTDDNVLQTNGEAHYLRFEVLLLIESVRTVLLTRASSRQVEELLSEINEFVGMINTHKQEHQHPLWDILLTELNTCKTSLENRNHINVDTPHIMTQHVGYLGRMRGIPAHIPDVTEDVANDTGLTPVPLERTFSNFAQRNISSQLQASVTPMRRHRASTDDSDPHGILTPSSTPVSGRSPLMRTNGMRFPQGMPIPFNINNITSVTPTSSNPRN